MSKDTTKEVEEDNFDCGTKIANLEKSLKKCRGEKDDLNKNLEELKKRNLLLK